MTSALIDACGYAQLLSGAPIVLTSRRGVQFSPSRFLMAPDELFYFLREALSKNRASFLANALEGAMPSAQPIDLTQLALMNPAMVEALHDVPLELQGLIPEVLMLAARIAQRHGLPRRDSYLVAIALLQSPADYVVLCQDRQRPNLVDLLLRYQRRAIPLDHTCRYAG